MNTAVSTPKRDDDELFIDIPSLLRSVWSGKKWIAGAMALGLAGSIAFVALQPQAQTATATLQVEGGSYQSKNFILNDVQTGNFLELLGSTKDISKSDGIQILQSFSTLSETVSTLHLTADPVYNTPFFGKLSRFKDEQPRIRVQEFTVPRELLNKKFTVTITQEGYELKTPDGKVLAGKLGATVTDKAITITIADSAKTQPGDSFTIRPQTPADAVAELGQDLNVSEKGKGTNLIALTYTGSNALRSEEVLSTVISVFNKEYLKYKAQKNDATLQGIEKQIPVLKENLDKAEQNLKTMVQQGAEASQVQRVRHEVEVQQTIYHKALQNLQELKIFLVNDNNNIRLLDPPTYTPQKSKTIPTVLAGTIGAGFLSTLVLLAVAFFRRRIGSAEVLENLGITSYANLPWTNHSANHSQPLAMAEPDNPTVEALRMLRAHLLVQVPQARNNAVLLTPVSTQAGSSFAASNLAVLLQQAGHSVLLLDADMRQGALHQHFQVAATPGLSDYLQASDAAAPIQHTALQGLDIIARGGNTQAPADLLARPDLANLLRHIQTRYDFVLIDAPCAATVSDASVLGQLAGTTLLVVRVDNSSERDLAQSLQRLRNSGVSAHGALLNGAKPV